MANKPNKSFGMPDKNTLRLSAKPGKSDGMLLAEMAFSSSAANANTARTFARGTFGELDLMESIAALQTLTGKVHSGDLKGAEATLTAQSVALDSIFNELARRAALNMGEYLGATETYLKLALKAQSQCRATLETLAAIKNPPIVYAKQANVTTGPQQINNGATTPSRARENEIQPNELLTVQHGKTLDSFGTGETSGTDSTMEAVGAIQRPENGEG